MGQRLKENFTGIGNEYYICMSFTLASEAEARKFVIASEDIMLSFPDVTIQMFNFADYVKGEPPPPRPDGNHAMNKDWCLLVGIITGPKTTEIPDFTKNAKDTEWAQKIIEILEFHGLKEQFDMVH